MEFDPIPAKKVNEELAFKISEYGKYLGRSEFVKDTFWACYEYRTNYYIMLNDDYRDCWLADMFDIEIYNEVPAK